MNPFQNQILKFIRIPEEELMESFDQVEAYTKANFEEAHQFIINKLIDHLPPRFVPQTILDLGAGSGDITSRLLKLFSDSHLTNVDGSKSMIEKNEELVKKFFPNANVTWINQKIQEFIPERHFDLIFSNSLLHHVSDPYDFWSAIQRSCDQNSFIFICDLLRPEKISDVESIVNRYSKDEKPILKEDFYNSLLAAYRMDEIEQMLRLVRLDNKLKIDQITDRHWICYSKQIL